MIVGNLVEYFSRWRRLIFQTESDAAVLYSCFRSNGVHLSSDGAPLLNMGYWRGISAADRDGLERANQALFDLVIDAADIQAGETVIEGGSGVLSNSLRCAARTDAARIVTLNVCGTHNRLGLKRVCAARLESRVHVLQACATRIPQATGSVDRALSVEAAFHFLPRQDFFGEVARVLRPGGTLTLVDLVAPPPAHAAQRLCLDITLRGLQMPRVNVYDREEYARRVRQAGYRIREARSIHAEVYLPFRSWMFRHPAISLNRDVCFEFASTGFFVYPWDYIFLHAERM